MIGILVTTVGISLLTLGLVGASIEVYRQLLTAIVERQVSAVTQGLPSFLRPEDSAAEEAEPASGSAQILASLIENLVNSPVWLPVSIVGIALIYLGLYLTQRPRLQR